MSAWKKLKVIAVASTFVFTLGLVGVGCGGGDDTQTAAPANTTAPAGGSTAVQKPAGTSGKVSENRQHAIERIEKRNRRMENKRR